MSTWTVEKAGPDPRFPRHRQRERWYVKRDGEWVLDFPRGGWIRPFRSEQEARDHIAKAEVAQ